MTMGYRLWVWLVLSMLPGCQQTLQETSPPRALAVETGCNPAEDTCRAQGDGIDIAFRLGRSVHALTPFPVYVTVRGLEPEAVTTEFRMEGMDMGQNRYRLERQRGQWQAQVVLPACTRGRHHWIALVAATRGRQGVSARFPFAGGQSGGQSGHVGGKG
jgi:hypothetical protein